MKLFLRRVFKATIASCFSFAFLPPLFADAITFSADTMSGTMGKKSSEVTLAGAAHVSTGDMEITADSIILSGEEFRFITAEDSVTAIDSEKGMKFVCGKINFDKEAKTAILENSVHIEDTENGVTADAQVARYNQKVDTLILQVDVLVKQKDNVCTGTYAMYHKKSQVLELNGSPKIVQNDDIFRAQRITLHLDTQEIVLTGTVSGSMSTSNNNQSMKE